MGRGTIQVVGGGFSGLAAAFFLVKEGFSVRLVEEQDRLGGMLETLETPYGLVERAANALLSNALVEETAAELGIELVPTLPVARKRFIYRAGKPRRWPLGVGASSRFLVFLLRFFFFRSSLRPCSGENVQAWGERTLGKEATNYLLVPGLSGIYAGDSRALSASLILGRFFRREEKPEHGRWRGSVAPREGMGEWGRKFRSWLEARGVELVREPEKGLPTVIALPPPRAREFLSERAPGLGRELEKVEMLPVVSVTCFFPDSAPSLHGFGCLFPRSEGFRVLGVLANNCIFPGRARPGWISETWIFGGATDRGIIGLPDEELLALIGAERRKIFGVETKIQSAQVSRWPRAIPHYNLALESFTARREGDYILFGTYLGDLGLARVLFRARELARSFR